MSLNIHQRLHAVMQECDYLQKESKAGMRYKIVSHDKVTAYVRPVLVKHGVVYYPVSMARAQNGNRTEIDLAVRFANIDEPTDYIDVVSAGYGVDDQDKGPGKAISYAVKYCLLKALGLETGDDPDETQDEKANHKPAQSTRPPAQRAPDPGRASLTRDEKFFAGSDYDLDAKTLGGLSKWETAYRNRAAECRDIDELDKLEKDNRRWLTPFCDKAQAQVVENLRQYMIEIRKALVGKLSGIAA